MKHLPKVAQKDVRRLLLGATAFPFGEPEMIDKQCQELAQQTDGTLDACLQFADWQLTRDMAKYNQPESSGATMGERQSD